MNEETPTLKKKDTPSPRPKSPAEIKPETPKIEKKPSEPLPLPKQESKQEVIEEESEVLSDSEPEEKERIIELPKLKAITS